MWSPLQQILVQGQAISAKSSYGVAKVGLDTQCKLARAAMLSRTERRDLFDIEFNRVLRPPFNKALDGHFPKPVVIRILGVFGPFRRKKADRVSGAKVGKQEPVFGAYFCCRHFQHPCRQGYFSTLTPRVCNVAATRST